MALTLRKPSRRLIESHQRKVDAARAQWGAASSALTTWAIDNGLGHIRWTDLRPILERDVPKMLATNDNARHALDQAEQAAIDAWCAWRGTHGLLFWN